MAQSARPDRLQLLLIEDNAGDVRLIREAFRTNGQEVEIAVVRDGVDALDYLRGSGAYVSAPRPDLILLDLNLPRKSGREVLREVKADDGLSAIPVVILTTSAADEDIAFSYRTHANTYIIKPVNLDRFLEVIGSIGAYWSHIACLPGGNDGENGNPAARPV
ncbi:MAG TPA: response regulator [Methanoregulaceae archaeon]|nr:response regulator [Methanoregulaceae archaeon]